MKTKYQNSGQQQKVSLGRKLNLSTAFNLLCELLSDLSLG